MNSLIMALGDHLWQDRHLLDVRLCHCIFPFPFSWFGVLDHLFTLMLPVEVRIVPTYEVIANLNLLNSYTV